MKRLFFTLSLIGSLVLTSSYAAGTDASPSVTEAFKNSFSGAKEVAWEQVGVLHKATFVLEGQYRSAFFNSEGDLIAETQNLPSTKLPKALKASLKSELQGHWITNLFVVSIEGAENYYVTVENADTSVVLKSAGKKWMVYKKSDK